MDFEKKETPKLSGNLKTKKKRKGILAEEDKRIEEFLRKVDKGDFVVRKVRNKVFVIEDISGGVNDAGSTLRSG